MMFASFKRFARSTNFSGLLRVSVLLVASSLLGCGKGGSTSSSSEEAEHIGKVGALITEFKSANAGNNPKSIEELKTWAINNGKAEDKDFISTRDKEPYVIEPMAMMRGGGGMMASKMPLIVHESKGVNGKKYVLQGTATVGSEMSEGGLNTFTKGRDDKSIKAR
jgi:hypothetical protein